MVLGEQNLSLDAFKPQKTRAKKSTRNLIDPWGNPYKTTTDAAEKPKSSYIKRANNSKSRNEKEKSVSKTTRHDKSKQEADKVEQVIRQKMMDKNFSIK